jgi:sec-independent protein translocase protein TatB
MFDIGALELVVIGVVALLVVGPERLPKLARTAGLWMGHARRALASVKDEIDREIKAEELKAILQKQAQSNPLQSIIEEDGGLRSSSNNASVSGKVESEPRLTGVATPQPPATRPPGSNQTQPKQTQPKQT